MISANCEIKYDKHCPLMARSTSVLWALPFCSQLLYLWSVICICALSFVFTFKAVAVAFSSLMLLCCESVCYCKSKLNSLIGAWLFFDNDQYRLKSKSRSHHHYQENRSVKQRLSTFQFGTSIFNRGHCTFKCRLRPKLDTEIEFQVMSMNDN